jgi:hypothetical protein
VTLSHCVRFTNISSQAAHAWPPCSCDTMLQFLRIVVNRVSAALIRIYVVPAWPGVEIIVIILGATLSYVYCPLLTVIGHFLSSKRLSSITDLINVTYQVITTVAIKRLFWDVMACSVVEIHRRFGGTHYLHLQGRWVSQVSSKQSDLQVENPSFLLSLLLSIFSGIRRKSVSNHVFHPS